MITNDTAWLLMRAAGLFMPIIKGLKLAELGNQWIGGYDGQRPFKPLAQWLGFKHTSFDLNGKDGAVILDFSQPLSEHFYGKFDIVTNYGTTEHIQTTSDFHDQWQAFANIHNLIKPNGAMIHVVPTASGAHYGSGAYENDFLLRLAQAADYEILEFYTSRSDYEHMAALLRKQWPDFPDLATFSQLGLIKPKAK